MATVINTPRASIAGGELKFEYGKAEFFALKFVSGKDVNGLYGPRVLFTTSDERKIWLDPEDGSDLERSVRELGLGAGDLIKVTKIRHARGGGHSLRVEPGTSDAAEPANGADVALKAQLEESIRIAQNARNARLSAAGAAREQSLSAAGTVSPVPPARATTNTNYNTVNDMPAPQITPASAKLAAALKAAIDASLEATVYAARQGLELQFTSEDIRCLAATAFIQNAKEAR